MSVSVTIELPESISSQISKVVEEAPELYEDVPGFVRHSILSRLDEMLGFKELDEYVPKDAEEKIVRYMTETPGPHDPAEVSITLGLDLLTTNNAIRSLFLNDVVRVVVTSHWVISKRE